MIRLQGQPDVKEEEMMARQTVKENLIWFTLSVVAIRVGERTKTSTTAVDLDLEISKMQYDPQSCKYRSTHRYWYNGVFTLPDTDTDKGTDTIKSVSVSVSGSVNTP